MSKWMFDQKFLTDVIEKGYVLLDNPHIPKTKKKNIRTDIATFNGFLMGDYENREIQITKPPRDVEKLKKYILKRMQEQYNNLGEETILWTMDLYFEDIFKDIRRGRKTMLSLDEQSELTIENYSDNSKRLLATAKSILSDEIIKQIQCAPNIRTSSYCYYDEITDLPYLIVNPNQAPWVLNHETEHAIEEIRKLVPNANFSELGPIFFELLFNDTLYKNQGFINIGDYNMRMFDTKESLIKLFHYFDIMMDFKNANFEVPTDMFIDSFRELCQSDEDEDVIDFIREEIASTEITEDMSYLYSYLKAIELREKQQDKKEDCAYILDPYIKTKKFKFQPTEELFKTYKRFTTEMKEKTKSK